MVEQRVRKQRNKGQLDFEDQESEIEFYSYISVDKIKNHITIAIGASVLFIFSTMVMNSLVNNGSWTSLVAPIALIGILLALVPPSEQWVYKAWQSRPERYEAGNQER